MSSKSPQQTPKKKKEKAPSKPSPLSTSSSSSSNSAPSNSNSKSARSPASMHGSKKSKRSCVWVIAVFLLVAVPLFFALDTIVHKGFIFDQNVLHAVGKEAIRLHGNNTQKMVNYIAQELNKKYPGHINMNQEWTFNNAGGAMGAMYLLHASLTEYVIIFGTPVGTEGHTGRFFADDYFIILQGEQWAFNAGALDREVYKPGEMHHLPRGEAQQYRMPDRCWALEYARGWIPLMLPFGLADTLSSTLDFYTFGRTFYVYAKCVVNELLQGKF